MKKKEIYREKTKICRLLSSAKNSINNNYILDPPNSHMN